MGTITAPETLIAVVYEKGRRGILESFVIVTVNALLHEMLAIDRFTPAVPVPEHNREISRE